MPVAPSCPLLAAAYRGEVQIFERVRRVPPEVRWLTLLFALVLVGWAQLAPLGRAPDESVHVDLTEHMASVAAYPDYDDRVISQAPVRAWLNNSPVLIRLTPEAAPPTGGGPTRNELGGDAPTESINQMPQHPPLYYRGLGLALRGAQEVGLVDDDSVPYDRQWQLLRLANVALVAPLPALAWAASRRLGGGRRMSQTAAAVPLCLPQLTHVGSTVNNDNLLILLGGVLAVLLAGVTTGDRRWTTAIGVGLLAGAALLTKAFGLAFLPWIVAAYAAPLLRDRGSRRSALRPAATRALAAVAVAVATGGWWMLRNVVRHGEPSPSVLDPYLTNAPEGFDPDFVWYGRHAVATIAQRFWGAFGYYEAALPTWSVVVVSALLGAVLGAAFLRTRQNQDPSPLGRRALFAYGSVLITTLGLVLYRAGSLYVQGGQTPALQGRYMFGAVVVLAVVAGRGAARLAGRRATVATFAAGVLLQAAALHVTLVTWWAEPDASLARSLRAMVRWSPWPDAAVVVLLAAIVAVVIRCAQVLWRSSVDPSPA